MMNFHKYIKETFITLLAVALIAGLQNNKVQAVRALLLGRNLSASKNA
jgi:hypothetical protein